MKKFKRAQAQNKASIEKHLEANAFLESSSEDDDDGKEAVLQQAVGKVLSNYEHEGGDTEKVLSYLTDIFQSGGAICLICISSVKKSDPIWNCRKCYTFMHLPCVQHWIRDSLSYKQDKGITPLWACPKCRMEYKDSEIPAKYVCFCGKSVDPEYQPWSIPHSCGEVCAKDLQIVCGHKCHLLCHPGPCPPCPKMVMVPCFCGKQPERPRRCNAKEWGCGGTCGKRLKTCEHSCTMTCHPGDCPPCSEILSSSCNCGLRKEPRNCNELFWRCEKVCNRRLSCNVHVCEEHCHRSDDCGPCPFEKNRTCPCGKKKYAISCKQTQAPTCGDTCGKLLDCGAHYCNMRCHADKCGQCLEVVKKTCRCNSFTKEITCGKEFHCNKKCTQMRLCGRHPCNKKCCDCLLKNNFNVCEKTCDNTLNCRKHACSAPCHSGPCYPCPRTVVIQCRCGSSKITVPCGTVKKIKPPNCNKMCKIPPVCHHLKRESHKCHRGACPPCKKTCQLVRDNCGHACPAVCHYLVWIKVKMNGVNSQPAGPWDQQKDKWEEKTLPCPPCEVSVMVTCLGGHETVPYPCYKAIPNSCLRECGRILGCTNHRCEKLCHLVGDNEDAEERDRCTQCEKSCALARPKGCTHSCDEICHRAPCKPCKQLVRVTCHCGINTLYIRCVKLTSAGVEERDEMLKCGNQCPKNFACGHRCIEDCHSGTCRKEDFCSKKVKIWCKCKRIKKEFSCKTVRAGQGVVNCDEVCQKKKTEEEEALQLQIAKKRKEEEIRNQKEIEMFERKFKPRKKGKERNRIENEANSKTNAYLKFGILSVGIVFLAFVLFYINGQFHVIDNKLF